LRLPKIFLRRPEIIAEWDSAWARKRKAQILAWWTDYPPDDERDVLKGKNPIDSIHRAPGKSRRLAEQLSAPVLHQSMGR